MGLTVYPGGKSPLGFFFIRVGGCDKMSHLLFGKQFVFIFARDFLREK